MSLDWSTLPTSSSGDKYSIGAVATLYELEPDLVDIVVEGTSDANLISWYLKSHNIDGEVYPVDARYEVPEQYVRSLGLSPNSRNRAIALAVFLIEEHGFTGTNLTAFVDADYADTLGPIPVSNQNVVMTDFPSIECYALQDAPLEKFLRIAASMPKVHTSKSVRAAVMPALREIYAVRAMLAQHDVAIHGRYVNECKFEPANRGYDCSTAVRKSLGPSMGQLGITQQECMNEVHAHVQWFIDRELYCRGHDIANVLFKYLNLKSKFGTTDATERALVASLEASDLDSHHAFRRLRTRVLASA